MFTGCGLCVTQSRCADKNRVVAHRFRGAGLCSRIPDGDIKRAGFILLQMQLAEGGVGMGYAAQKERKRENECA